MDTEVDIESLSSKKSKALITKASLRADDCIERAELRARAIEAAKLLALSSVPQKGGASTSRSKAKAKHHNKRSRRGDRRSQRWTKVRTDAEEWDDEGEDDDCDASMIAIWNSASSRQMRQYV